jgi:hypothetical protein
MNKPQSRRTKRKDAPKQESKPVTKSQVAQMIKATTNNLVKYTDSPIGVGGYTSAFHVTALNMPSSGAGESAMSGVSIDINTFDLRLIFQDNAGVGSNSSFFRVLLIQTMSDFVPNSGEIFQNVSNTDFGIVSPLNYANHNKTYRCLFDQTVSIDAYNTTCHMSSINIPSKVKRARFDAANATWATGQAYLVIVADLHYTSTTVVYNSNVRMNWLDA